MKKAATTKSSQLALDFEAVWEPPAVEMKPSTVNEQAAVPTSTCLEVEATFRAGDSARAPSQDFGTLVTAALRTARRDLTAVEGWIAARCDHSEGDVAGRPQSTATVYRREARRFILWLAIDRGRSLQEARLEDCVAYRAFMSAPAPAELWCAPRGTRLSSAAWRPFEGPLCPRARRHAITVLSCLYRFLQDQLYLAGNPWSGLAMPRNSAQQLDPGRSLSRSQWKSVEEVMAAEPKAHRDRQLVWATRLLYRTGLRLSEVTQAYCGDLRWVSFEATVAADGIGGEAAGARGTWVLRVLGKGLKLRDVPVDSQLVDELGDILAYLGSSNDPRDHPERPLLVHMPRGQDVVCTAPRPMSGQSLHRQLKVLFALAAQQLIVAGRRHEAGPLLRASTHWLRHTNASHSVEAGVPLDVISRGLGHANLQVTSVYIAAGDLQRRAREAGRLREIDRLR